MKRKLQIQESEQEEEEQVIKMLKLNQSSLVPGRKFNFKLTDKKAKGNLIKSANRSHFEVEHKQKSSNLKFSAGAYIQVAKPMIKECEDRFQSQATFNKDNMEIKVDEIRAGKELNDKHVDTKIVFSVNNKKVVMHCYNSTQNMNIAGTIYFEFIEKFLVPMFENNIKKSQI